MCNTCTVRLMEIAYRRAPWFRLVREPLKGGMKLMAFILRIDPDQYDVKTAACRGCLRFYKLALKEESGLFRRLNDLLNPVFDALVAKIVTPEEMKQANEQASLAMSGQDEDRKKNSSK